MYQGAAEVRVLWCAWLLQICIIYTDYIYGICVYIYIYIYIYIFRNICICICICIYSYIYIIRICNTYIYICRGAHGSYRCAPTYPYYIYGIYNISVLYPCTFSAPRNQVCESVSFARHGYHTSATTRARLRQPHRAVDYAQSPC